MINYATPSLCTQTPFLCIYKYSFYTYEHSLRVRDDL